MHVAACKKKEACVFCMCALHHHILGKRCCSAHRPHVHARERTRGPARYYIQAHTDQYHTAEYHARMNTIQISSHIEKNTWYMILCYCWQRYWYSYIRTCISAVKGAGIKIRVCRLHKKTESWIMRFACRTKNHVLVGMVCARDKWRSTQLAKLSFNHSVGRTHSWRIFFNFIKKRAWNPG